MAIFCIHYTPGPKWQRGRPTQHQELFEHGRYMHGLLRDGQLIMAGPFTHDGGMCLIECGTEAEARDIVAGDPAVISEIMTAAIRQWTPLFDRASGLSPFGKLQPRQEKVAAEHIIRRRIEKWVRALCAKDIDGVMSLYAASLVSFDLVAPLQYGGAEGKRQAWQAAFALYGSFAYEVRGLEVAAHGELAFVHSLNHVSAILANGQPLDMWLRWTACFRQIGGTWLIVHDHVSVPAELEHRRAVVDLKP